MKILSARSSCLAQIRPVQVALSLASRMEGLKNLEPPTASSLLSGILDDIPSTIHSIPNTTIKIYLDKFQRWGLLENKKNPPGHYCGSMEVSRIHTIKGHTSNIEMIKLSSQASSSFQHPVRRNNLCIKHQAFSREPDLISNICHSTVASTQLR